MKHDILDLLPPGLRAKVFSRRLMAGQAAFLQGETARTVYFLQEGKIRLHSHTREQWVNLYCINRGEWFAEIALALDAYPFTATAERPSSILAIPRPLLADACAHSPALAAVLFERLARHAQRVQTALEARAIRSAPERILHYLQMQAGRGEQPLRFEYPLKDLAYELGLAPESLYRAFAKLQAQGVLQRNKRRVYLESQLKSAPAAVEPGPARAIL